jgi:uncharacterized protein YndB with AHSA1/START domain
MVLRAPRERVFQAIADPKQIVKWFPDRIEGKLDKGERPVFDFGDYGKVAIYVVASDPHDYFAYRWVPSVGASEADPLKQANTLVEFHLEDAPEGTRLKLTESGFASLPKGVLEKSFKDNNEGWDAMLPRLEKYLGE